jgi:hypothetical protein
MTKRERGFEKLIVVSNPREGVVQRDYAVGEYRDKRFYEERRERGWLTLAERLKQKGMEE